MSKVSASVVTRLKIFQIGLFRHWEVVKMLRSRGLAKTIPKKSWKNAEKNQSLEIGPENIFLGWPLIELNFFLRPQPGTEGVIFATDGPNKGYFGNIAPHFQAGCLIWPLLGSEVGRYHTRMSDVGRENRSWAMVGDIFFDFSKINLQGSPLGTFSEISHSKVRNSVFWAQ